MTRPRRLVLAVLAAAGLLAGCSKVIDGSGSAGGTSGPDFPSSSSPGASAPPSVSAAAPSSAPDSVPDPSSGPSGGPASSDFRCPEVTLALERLAFTCIRPTMTYRSDDMIWPVIENYTVEPKTRWSLDMGARFVGATNGASLESFALGIRAAMVAAGNYGQDPKVSTTGSSNTTVDGHQAHLLQSTFTLNPTFRANEGTAVKVEKSWTLAIEIAPGVVTLWYTSVPDLVQQLWARVPSVIASIRVD